MAEDFTMRFKADVSGLKLGISDASKAIKEANLEFKATSASMDDWAHSADGITAKLNNLKVVLNEQKWIAQAYDEQLRRQQEAYKINGERVEALKAKIKELTEQGYTRADAEVQKYEKALKQVSKEQDNNEKACDELRVKILQQKAVVAQTEQQIRKYEKAEKDLEKESKSLTKTIDDQEKELKQLKADYAEAVVAEGKNSESAKRLANEIERTSSALKDNRKRMEEAKKEADKLDDSIDDVDQSARNSSEGFTIMKAVLADLASNAIRRVVSGLKDMAKNVIQTGMDFETSMSKNRALFGATEEEMELLTETAKQYGETTVFSATESAEALGYMALAGWDAEKSAKELGGVLALASAGQMELAEASDLVTDYLSAFSRSEIEASEFADILAYSQANANTSVTQLGDAYRNSAANLNAAGQDIYTVTSLLSMMANQGSKGAKAGTMLSAMMRDITAKMDKGAISIGKTNVQVMDAEGNYRDLTEILKDVQKAAEGMGDAEKATALSMTFTSDSIRGVNLLLNAGVDEAEKFENQLRNCDGSAQEMADTMNDNVAGALKLLKSNVEGKMIQVFEKVRDPIKKALGTLSQGLDSINWDKVGDVIGQIATKVVDFLSYVIKNSDKVIKIIKGIATALATVFVINKVAKFVESIKTLWSVLASNPIALLITLTTALTVAIIATQKAYDKYVQSLYGMNEEEQELIDNIKAEKQALDAVNDARKQANREIENEYHYEQNLWDELQRITDENGNIKKGYEDRANVITNLLADALGMEIEIVDGQIQKYDELKASIDGVIEKKRAEAMLEANKEAYTNAVANQAQAYANYRKEMEHVSATYDEMIQAQERLEAIDRERNESITADQATVMGLNDAYEKEKKNLDVITEKYNEQKSALQDAEDTYYSYIQTIQNYEGAISAVANGDLADMSTALDKLSNNFLTTETATREMLERQLANFQEQYEFMKDGVENGMAGVTQAQVDAMKELVDSAQAELDKASPKAKRAGQKTGSEYTSGISKSDNQAKSAGQKLGAKANEGLASVDSTPYGRAFGQGFINGMGSMTSSILSMAMSLGGTAVSGLKQKINSNSPSKVTEKIGEDFDLGFMLGIKGYASKAVGAVKNMAGDAVNALTGANAKANASGMVAGMTVGGSGGGTGGTSNMNTTNFTQIINAPKQPSRIELYRQTRNLLTLAEGMS